MRMVRRRPRALAQPAMADRSSSGTKLREMALSRELSG